MTWWKWLLVHLIYPMQLFWFLRDTKVTEVCYFCSCFFPNLSIEILSLLTLAVIKKLYLVVYWCNGTCIWNKDLKLNVITEYIIEVYSYMFYSFVKVNIQNTNHEQAKALIFNCEQLLLNQMNFMKLKIAGFWWDLDPSPLDYMHEMKVIFQIFAFCTRSTPACLDDRNDTSCWNESVIEFDDVLFISASPATPFIMISVKIISECMYLTSSIKSPSPYEGRYGPHLLEIKQAWNIDRQLTPNGWV